MAVTEAGHPRWLSFFDGRLDSIDVPPEFLGAAAPTGVLAPHLARRGVQLQRLRSPATPYLTIAIRDVSGRGLAPERVALRRAIGLALDTLRLARAENGIAGDAAQSLIGRHLSGHDTAFRSENVEHSPTRASALLDMHAFLDRDGDGWRDLPDGKPLRLDIRVSADGTGRMLSEALARA